MSTKKRENAKRAKRNSGAQSTISEPAKSKAQTTKAQVEKPAPEIKIDSRINDKDCIAYVESLPDKYDRPKQNSSGYHALVILGELVNNQKREFTTREFMNVIAKLSGKSFEQLRALNTRNGSFPDGRIRRALYALECLAKATMKTQTKDGKPANSFGQMKYAIVCQGESGGKSVSIDKGSYTLHPKVTDVESTFPKFPQDTVKRAIEYFLYV